MVTYLFFLAESSLSRCMANLGVEPLLLESDFLLDPILVFLALRLFLVTLVLDTIAKLHLLIRFRKELPTYCPIVKFISTGGLIFWLMPRGTLAGPLDILDSNFIIAKGEQIELKLENVKKYSIGNKQVITHKFFPTRHTFLIKGKMLGFSDLIIWKKNGEKINYSIYVLSKKSHLKIIYLAQILKKQGLKINIAGPLIMAEGIIDNIHSYRLIHKLLNKNPENIFIKGKIKKELRNSIIGEIYKFLLREDVHNISCYDKSIQITCQYNAHTPPGPALRKHFEQKYNINFLSVSHKNVHKNYRAKIKLIQIEKLDGQELDLGLHSLQGTLDELFHSGLSSIVLRNKFLLNKKNVTISTLAEPEIILMEHKKALIEMGSEIPFTNKIKDTVHTEWKFAGLKITLEIKALSNNILLTYRTKLTHPKEGSINGSIQSSSILLELNKPTQIFQIGLKTSADKREVIPIIGDIPVLGLIFSSKSKQNNYKKISGIIVLEKYGS